MFTPDVARACRFSLAGSITAKLKNSLIEENEIEESSSLSTRAIGEIESLINLNLRKETTEVSQISGKASMKAAQRLFFYRSREAAFKV